MSMQHAQYMLLFLVLVVNSGFKFYGVTRSYASRLFLCTLGGGVLGRGGRKGRKGAVMDFGDG